MSLFAYLALALLFVAGVYANGTLLRAYLKKEKYENPFSYVINSPYPCFGANLITQASNLAPVAA